MASWAATAARSRLSRAYCSLASSSAPFTGDSSRCGPPRGYWLTGARQAGRAGRGKHVCGPWRETRSAAEAWTGGVALAWPVCQGPPGNQPVPTYGAARREAPGGMRAAWVWLGRCSRSGCHSYLAGCDGMARGERHRWRTDEELLGNAAVMVLLAAVAAGRVIRGSGGETNTWAPHMLDGEPIRLQVRWLADAELVTMPISGPPALAPRGRRLLDLAARQPRDAREAPRPSGRGA
jgi:hypothetical protein